MGQIIGFYSTTSIGPCSFGGHLDKLSLNRLQMG